MLKAQSSTDEAYKKAHSRMKELDRETMERWGIGVDAALESGEATAVLKKRLYGFMATHMPFSGWDSMTLLERLRAIRPNISHTPALRLHSVEQVDRAPTILLAEDDSA